MIVRCRWIVPAFAWLSLLDTSVLRAQTAAVPGAETKTRQGVLLAKPYLQLGQAPSPGSLVMLWHADDVDAGWSVSYRPSSASPWREIPKLEFRRIAVSGAAPHRLYKATLNELEAGAIFSYRIRRDGREVFLAEARAPKGPNQAHRFVVFGDCGAGTPEEKQIAHQAYLANPDYLMITGDIVYARGRVGE